MKLGHAFRIGAAVIVAAIGVVAAAGSAGADSVTGAKIAYMSMRDGQADIYSMDANGSFQFNITHDKRTVKADVEPAWSPGGSMLAFERQYSNQRGAVLMVIKADGSKLRVLSPPSSRVGTRDSHPSWSPDGGAVVFTSNRDGNFDLYAVKASGLGLRQLTFTKGSVRNLSPQWSPDGRTILFVRSGTSTVPGSPAHLYLLKLASGAVVQLTRTPIDRGVSVGDQSPTWSANGTRIAFTSDRFGSNDIFVMNANGSNLRRVTTKLSNDNHPTFAPDGRALAFLSDRTGATEIFNVSAIVGEPTQLTFDRALKADPSWQRAMPLPNAGIMC